MRHLLTLTLAALLVPRSAEPVPGVIFCTETTVLFQGQKGPPQKVRNPIAEALTKAKPGETIWLDPGVYPAFTIGLRSNSPANAATKGGTREQPIVIQGQGPGVQIVGAEGDTIGIDQAIPNGWITFRNLVIVPGKRSGVLFYQRGDGRLHEGYAFEDVHILGAFDFDTGQGKRTKWGVWGQALTDFRFVGVSAPAQIQRISEEHAFYLQNCQGPITIENVFAQDLGRTFCQFTNRSGDGAVGKGDVIVKDCVVEDACIAQGDGFKGGSAFTICGRHEGTFLFEHNVYRAGFRKERLRFTKPGVPYGTGAFMAWEADRAGLNGTLVLRDNEFRFAPGTGDRAVVSIGGCRQVLVLGANQFVSGGEQPALALDPLNPQGRPVSTPNQTVFVAPATKLTGKLELRGGVPSAEELAHLHREPTAEEPAPREPPPGD
ncbi:MAG: hypothetical protein ABL998_16415 [Planctomycetota bacterium]